ncbi:Na+/H+ antiporter [Rhodococcus sp. CX]|uniref:Na+/H+ antiporter n=1 Tax=Rhodococcus sp. CX TaxID=2789880 RepID=UPI0018CD2041|nr:Na+/H+ antiporter [Rhodococcus sp. CX]MBH0121383.1 Na+/H+ antiporter [Rhodococcus sp. CX]
MNGLQVTVLLGVAVLAAAMLAPRLHIAAPLILLIGGLALGFVPDLRAIELPPEAVLLLFLPVMLFWESLTTSLRSIKQDFRGIVILSTLLVVATAFAVAGIAHALGIPWPAALVLGAALAPPDATAVAALGRALPHRNFMLLKAESLTNDGTALVLYAIAVGIAVGGNYTALEITGLVVLSYAGGLAAGAVVAGLAYLTLRRVHDALSINIALILVPFVAYLLAELIHASGVLAVVAAGLIIAYTSGRISTASSRRQTESVWPLGAYLLNGSLFVLIGLEVQAVTQDLSASDFGRLSVIVAAVWVGLVAVRFGFLTATVTLIRLLDRRPSQRARRMSYRARLVSAFAGFRGAVSLAIALSVPTTTNSGEAFPARDDIIFVTAGVVVLTLLVQGPLLPSVVRWAQLPENSTAAHELALAEHAITTSALAALPEIADKHRISRPVRHKLAEDYNEHLELIAATTQTPAPSPERKVDPLATALRDTADEAAEDGTGPETPPCSLDEHAPLARYTEYTQLQLALLSHQRDELSQLRHTSTIDDSVARQIQTRLDVEELRLTGVDSFE